MATHASINGRIPELLFSIYSATLKLGPFLQLTFIYMIRHIYGVSDMRKHASVCEYELIHIISLDGLANETQLEVKTNLLL